MSAHLKKAELSAPPFPVSSGLEAQNSSQLSAVEDGAAAEESDALVGRPVNALAILPTMLRAGEATGAALLLAAWMRETALAAGLAAGLDA
jgi:DNA helicase TIP49 (TBP-interacting protein)